MQQNSNIKVPKIVSTGKYEYILVQQCNKDLWLYQDMLYGYKRCFTSFELGIRKKRKVEV